MIKPIAIIGGGFAGIQAAKNLLFSPVEIVLIHWLWNYFSNEQSYQLICPTQSKTTAQFSRSIFLNSTTLNKT